MGHKVKQSLMSSRIDFFYYAFRNILLVSIPLLILSALILGLSTSHSSAVGSGSSGTDNVQLVLSTSCTVNAVVTSEHTVSLNGGQLDNNVGNTKLSAYCNDNNGYSIYAIGSSGDIDGNTDLVNTVNESYNIHTGVYNENNASNPSSWAMKLTAGTGTGIDPTTGGSVPTTPPTIINGYDNYSAIPNVYTQVAKRTSGTSMITDSDASGSYLNATYQIYANSYQPAGTYNGKVKYAIVHPNSNNDTIPDLDTAFAVAGKMKAYEEGGNSYYAMQDMDAGICSMVTNDGESTSTQLVDLRDNKLYWITKLKDGHCWMTQNLDFDIDANTTLNSNTTDLNVAYNPTTEQYAEYNNGYTESNGVIYWQPASSATTIDFQNNGPISGWQDSNTAPYTASKIDSTETGHASIGNYYNWTATIASNNSSGINTDNTIATNSICPKGWRLPNASTTDNEYNDFGRLFYEAGIIETLSNSSGGLVNYTSDGFNKLHSNPYYFIESGRIVGSSLNDPARGFYWSSTVNNNTYAYRLVFDTSGLWPATAYFRFQGKSVRCVARSVDE